MDLSFDSSEVVVAGKRPNISGFSFRVPAAKIKEAGRTVSTVSRKKKAEAVAADDTLPSKRVKTVSVTLPADPAAKKLLEGDLKAGVPDKKSKERKDQPGGSNFYDRERRREMLEEVRAKKAVEGDRPEIPVITNEEHFEFDEAALAEHLAGGRLPSLAPMSGFVWKKGFLPSYPNSVGAHIPHLSEVQDTYEKPEVLGAFSQELFRAFRLPYTKHLMQKDLGNALGGVMSHIFEIGSIIGQFKDDVDRKKGEMHFPEVDHSRLAALQHEVTWWQQAALFKARECRERQDRSDSMLSELTARIEELAVKDEENAQSSARTKELHDEEITRLTARIQELELETGKLQEEVKKRDPQEIISRFLYSKSFAIAAPMASLNLIRTAIYTELKKLGPHYPFIPEQVGYAEVSPEDFNNRSLPGYTWDETQDQLLDPSGQPVLKLNLPLKNHANTGLVYTWPEEHMPEDVTVPPPSPPEEDAEDDQVPPPGNE